LPFSLNPSVCVRCLYAAAGSLVVNGSLAKEVVLGASAQVLSILCQNLSCIFLFYPRALADVGIVKGTQRDDSHVQFKSGHLQRPRLLLEIIVSVSVLTLFSLRSRGFMCFRCFRWRGSIYKLLWPNTVVYILFYYALFTVYKCALKTDEQKK
jgi:hypothetical protein